MNVQYFMYLVNEVINNNLSLEDVRAKLLSRYEKWYVNYFLPYKNYIVASQELTKSLLAQGVVDKHIMNAFNEVLSYLREDENVVHNYMEHCPKMDIEDNIKDLENMLGWSYLRIRVFRETLANIQDTVDFRYASRLQKVKINRLWDMGKGIYDNSVLYCTTVLKDLKDILAETQEYLETK